MSVIEVSVPIRVTSRSNSREHWAARARKDKADAWAVAWALHVRRCPGQSWTVTLIRCGPRALDDDNLRDALKAVRDAVARWLIPAPPVIDRRGRVKLAPAPDGPGCPIDWIYLQRQCPRREARVVIRVEEMA
jgi:hypothetical protein